MARMVAALPAIIPDGMSPDDFAAITGLSREDSELALDDLVGGGIGRRQGDQYLFSVADKLSAAMLLVERGAPVDDVAVHLDWRSFEGLAARVLESRGFAVMRNLILTRPRREIDVVGVNLGVAVLIDCKHWQRCGPSALRGIVRRHTERTRQYVASTEGSMAVPVIVTLYRDAVDFVDKVPIVPIQQLPSFLDELYGNLGDIKTIETGSQ